MGFNGATSEDVAQLAAGTYTIEVRDAQGCANQLAVAIAIVHRFAVGAVSAAPGR